jgi:hypothetical protein
MLLLINQKKIQEKVVQDREEEVVEAQEVALEALVEIVVIKIN